MGLGGDGYAGDPLFETQRAKGRISFKLFAGSVFVGLCLIWVYRATQILNGEVAEGRWAWLAIFAAELWFGFYWILTISLRWKPTYHRTFKDRVSHRYREELPGVDIFVCTADPILEPPAMVISTVLSVMAYNYPPEKLSVYLSDDGGSELTFYALLEASRFAKCWIPFCNKFNLESRSPAAFFSGKSVHQVIDFPSEEWLSMQKLFKEMETRINTIAESGRIPEDVRNQHPGFAEWNPGTTARDHQAIVQILIDGRDPNALDIEGSPCPTLVYVAREKRPQYHHNFKAGAMNVLIRVSSEISNAPIILNVDCDMYSNNPEGVREALCFFMDEEKGHEIAYVQFPQNFNNITKNDIYSNSLRQICEVDFHGCDSYGGPLYIGSGCFHRRRSLCGHKYIENYREEWIRGTTRNAEESDRTLEEKAKDLATCTYEQKTQWGKEVGLKYGSPVEDVITGLSIQCRGWKSIYFNPSRKAFLGVAPITLAQTLVQHKRWSEGDFQIFLSEYCPLLYGHGKIKLGLQMGYSVYCLWAVNALPTLFYVIIPSLCLINGISLYPRISDVWFLPFAYVITTTLAYNLGECLWTGGTLKGWWNEQRMWMFKRTTSYLFAFIDSILKQLGFTETKFIITSKASDDDVSVRYEQEIMEFGSSSPLMFNILAVLAMLNLFCLVCGVKRVVVDEGIGALDLFLQLLLCGLLVIINTPIYQALFLRKDVGRMPTSVVFTSVSISLLACLIRLH